MLKELRVTGFALLDQVEINFGSGLNILTGETGAGKSILIDALGIILGSRASLEDIRSGSDRAIVEALFGVDNNDKIKKTLTEMGIEPEEDGSILISREINSGGRNSCRINGRIVTVSMLRDIGRLLVDLHGQHQHQSLLYPENHLEFLDSFCGTKITSIKNDVQQLYGQVMELMQKLNKLLSDEKEKEELIDLLKYQIDEIAGAELKSGEDEELLKEKKKLVNAEKIYAFASQAYGLLEGNEKNYSFSVNDALYKVLKILQELAKLDSDKMEVFSLVETISFQMKDIAAELRDYLEEIDYNSERVNQIEERLHIISQLKRKYGQNIEDILDFYTQANKKLEKAENIELELIKIKTDLTNVLQEYMRKASKLSDLRKEFAVQFSELVSNQLHQLGMNNAEFKCQVETTVVDEEVDLKLLKLIGESGLDSVEFLFSANQGEPLKQLSKIASGGELSRVMLALKVSLVKSNPVPTMIFDEIDVGVGGRTAYTIGDKLAEVSRNNQVICVTHLPQIACMADNHYYILKETENNRTYTKIYFLNETSRIKELSRMLGGNEDTEKISLEHAKELRQLAKKRR